MHTRATIVYHGSVRDRGIISFTDKDTEELILESQFEYIGLYYPQEHMFCWSWYQTFDYPESSINMAKQLASYAISTSHFPDRQSFVTPYFYVAYYEHIWYVLALTAAYIKKPFIYPFYQKLNDEDFVLIYLILADSDKVRELQEKVKGTPKWEEAIEL